MFRIVQRRCWYACHHTAHSNHQQIPVVYVSEEQPELAGTIAKVSKQHPNDLYQEHSTHKWLK